MNGNKQQRMGQFLSSAAKIIAKNEQMSPTSPKYIPGMSDPTSLLGADSGGDYDYGSMYEQKYTQPVVQTGPNGFTQAASNLPKSIFESMQTNPIQEYNGPMNGLSVLDSIIPPQQTRAPQPQTMTPQRAQINEDYYSGEKQMPSTEELLRRSRMLHEQVQPQTQQNVLPTGAGIDYSIIRLMIENCIANEFKALRKSMLNESRTGGDGNVIMSVGDSIKFIAKNGNVYEGKVKKIGNVNTTK